MQCPAPAAASGKAPANPTKRLRQRWSTATGRKVMLWVKRSSAHATDVEPQLLALCPARHVLDPPPSHTASHPATGNETRRPASNTDYTHAHRMAVCADHATASPVQDNQLQAMVKAPKCTSCTSTAPPQAQAKWGQALDGIVPSRCQVSGYLASKESLPCAFAKGSDLRALPCTQQWMVVAQENLTVVVWSEMQQIPSRPRHHPPCHLLPHAHTQPQGSAGRVDSPACRPCTPLSAMWSSAYKLTSWSNPTGSHSYSSHKP